LNRTKLLVTRWQKMGQDGTRWDKMGQDGQRWTKMDKDGQRWTKMDKDGQRWTKKDKDGQYHLTFSRALVSAAPSTKVCNVFACTLSR
jgi:hypothetical protein